MLIRCQMHAASVWVLLQFRVLPRRAVCELRQHAVIEAERSLRWIARATSELMECDARFIWLVP